MQVLTKQIKIKNHTQLIHIHIHPQTNINTKNHDIFV